MKYTDIKQRVYDQLKLPDSEVRRLGYAVQIPRLLNAALFRIANAVLPNLREYVVKLTRDKLPARVDMPPDFLAFADEQMAYLNGQPFTLSNFVGKSGIILNGAEVPNVNTDVLEYHIFYNADYPRVTDTALTWIMVSFTDPEVNTENYNTVEISINEYDVPDVAAMAIPHYIAGQLLSLDDKVRSIEEMNEFENLLAIVSTYRHERTRDYHSSRGWY
jgi:hypothetical protein